jgi:hypothetical protein
MVATLLPVPAHVASCVRDAAVGTIKVEALEGWSNEHSRIHWSSIALPELQALLDGRLSSFARGGAVRRSRTLHGTLRPQQTGA